MIVGVDVSSKRIDLAWLENGKPCRWHQELAKGHLIDRLRSIHIQWPHTDAAYPNVHTDGENVWVEASPGDVTEIAIEMPFGQSRTSIGALMAVVGIVTKQAPPWARVAWPSAGELRQAIGAKNTKQDAHQALLNLTNPEHTAFVITPCLSVAGWDEHELDALVACIGWTRILTQQDAA